MSGIHEKVADWVLSLPDTDRRHQVDMYCAYRKIMDAPLALWYVKIGYEWEQKKKELYAK
jgi:hypothetical protein